MCSIYAMRWGSVVPQNVLVLLQMGWTREHCQVTNENSVSKEPSACLPFEAPCVRLLFSHSHIADSGFVLMWQAYSRPHDYRVLRQLVWAENIHVIGLQDGWKCFNTNVSTWKKNQAPSQVWERATPKSEQRICPRSPATEDRSAWASCIQS